jgi:O-antigen/teichoic acid export membrane protein
MSHGRADFGARVAWGVGGSLLFALSQWLLVVAMARWGSARLVGDWTLALAITAPVFILAQCKLRFVLAADATREYPWTRYLALRVRSMGVAASVIGVVVLVAYRDLTGLLIILIALGKGVEGVCDIRYGRLQRDDDMRGITVALVRRAFVVLSLAVVTLWLTRSAAWTALAALAGQGIGLWLDTVSRRRPAAEPDGGPSLGALLRRTLPLGLATAIGSLQAGLPRFVLDAEVSREAVGTFSLLAYPYMVGALLVSAMTNVALPGLARRASASDWRGFRRVVGGLCGAGGALCLATVLVTWVVGEPAMRFLYGAHYAGLANELRWISLAVSLSWCFVFLGTALDALREYTPQPWIFGISTAVVAGSAFHFAGTHGMIGVAWAMVAGSVVEATLLGFVLSRSLTRARATERAAIPY